MGYFYKNHQNLSKNTPFLGVNETQNERSKEQGRSMVEMLGVLAIIGVLSIGAISGYRYAMNKYRANQVINELNLLSHQVAIAMMSKSGVNELKLGDPYDTDHKLTSAGYSFEFGCGDGTSPDCGGKYYFNLQNVSEGVCKELVQMSEHMQFIKDWPTNCEATDLNFVFELPDTNMSANVHDVTPDDDPYCNGYGSYDESNGTCTCMAGYAGPTCYLRSDCSEKGALYVNQISYTLDGNFYFEDIDTCSCGSDFGGASCEINTSCNNHGTYYYGVCSCEKGYSGLSCEIKEPDDNICGGSEKVDCQGSGMYCHVTNAGTSGDAGKDAVGTCHNAYDEKKTVKIKGETFVLSSVGMDWWSAQRFCRVLGKELANLNTDLGCSWSDYSGWSCDPRVYIDLSASGADGCWTSNSSGTQMYNIACPNNYINNSDRDIVIPALCK